MLMQVYDGVRSKLPEFLFPLAIDGIFGNDAPQVIDFYKDASVNWHGKYTNCVGGCFTIRPAA